MEHVPQFIWWLLGGALAVWIGIVIAAMCFNVVVWRKMWKDFPK